jgi:hypothetical protein
MICRSRPSVRRSEARKGLGRIARAVLAAVPLVVCPSTLAAEPSGLQQGGGEKLWTEVDSGAHVSPVGQSFSGAAPTTSAYDLGGCADPGIPRGSWYYRPYSIGEFVGVMFGSPLIDDWVDQKEGPFGGYRLGYDMHCYWGWEMRFALGAAALADSRRAIEAQHAGDDALGLLEGHPDRNRFDGGRDSRYFLWDVSVLYYPWGDAGCRPYLRFGMGAARVEFLDRLAVHRADTVMALPVAAGLKFRVDEVVVLRAEVADDIAFGSGSGFNNLHNLSLTGGIEVRFGGPRKAYWPWNPGRHYY